MSAVRLIVEHNEKLTDGYDVAESCGQVEWCYSILQQKEFLVALLRELVRERRSADPDNAEVVGRLRAAIDLLHTHTVDMTSIKEIVLGAIYALGGQR